MLGGQQSLGGRPAPFAHGGDEDRRHRIRRAVRDTVVELLERATGPEGFLELAGLFTETADADDLVEDDRPAPDRCHEQEDHDTLDNPVGLQEQRPDREVMGDGAGQAGGTLQGGIDAIEDIAGDRFDRCSGRCWLLRIHGSSSLLLQDGMMGLSTARKSAGNRTGRPSRPTQAMVTCTRHNSWLSRRMD